MGNVNSFLDTETVKHTEFNNDLYSFPCLILLLPIFLCVILTEDKGPERACLAQ